MTERDDNLTILAGRLEETLVRAYGPLLSGDSLRQALGYATLDALRQAISRRTIPVAVFSVPHRRSKHALTKDVARWLAEQRLGCRADGASNTETGEKGLHVSP